MDTATATAQMTRPFRKTYTYEFRSADTDTIGFIRDLDSLLTLENANGYTFQASVHAYNRAKTYMRVLAHFIRPLPRPEFVPDGEGGIDIEWEHGSKRFAISCRATPDQQDCLFWRDLNEGGYQASEVTVGRIVDRIDWLRSA